MTERMGLVNSATVGMILVSGWLEDHDAVPPDGPFPSTGGCDVGSTLCT